MAQFSVPEEYSSGFTKMAEVLMSQFTASFADGLKPPAPGAKWTPPKPSPAMTNLVQLQFDYMNRLSQLYTGAMLRSFGGESPVVTEPEKGDKRFGGKEWREQPGLDFLKQSYLLGAKFVFDTIDAAELDPRTRRRMRFFAKQFVDATSPANLLAANPDAFKKAVETKGASLAEGMKNLMEDARKGRITITDEGAFEVGRNLAITPGAVVLENEVLQLIQYSPTTETVEARPLVIFPPCINKYYILDLQPENSFVGHAVAQGHTVFIASWRNTTPEAGHLTWDDYLSTGVMASIDAARSICGTEQVDALGFCVGGTMLSCAIAVMKARGEDKVATLTLMATMLDFIDTGDIGLLVDENSVANRERTIGGGGILPGSDLGFVFSAIRANDLIWPYVINNYLKGTQPPAFDLLYWNADETSLPGPWYCWYMRNAYLENNIRIPGRTIQCGVPVDLGIIDLPAYILATREDHIVPWRTAYATTRLFRGPMRFTLGASGHIAGIVNPPAKKKRNYWIEGKPGVGADAWLASAKQVPGSWWSDWIVWLNGHGTQQVPARVTLGNAAYPPIEPAPGRYVKPAGSVS